MSTRLAKPTNAGCANHCLPRLPRFEQMSQVARPFFSECCRGNRRIQTSRENVLHTGPSSSLLAVDCVYGVTSRRLHGRLDLTNQQTVEAIGRYRREKVM
jgi:hypothetical protein